MIKRGDLVVNIYDDATLLETVDILDLSDRSFRVLMGYVMLNGPFPITSPITYNIQAGKITPIKGRRAIDENDGGEV